MIFACAVTNVETEAQACLLAESIRVYAGRLAESDVWALMSNDLYHRSDLAGLAFERLGVEVKSFGIDSLAHGFPFAGKVYASATAERMALESADLLVWLDPDSIVIQEPAALRLPPGKVLGCRPVDHVLIGSPYDEPADAFWRSLYRTYGVSQEQLFPMTTSADEVTIRPYINAGMLVVRPEVGLLQLWQRKFLEALSAGHFRPFFGQNVLYKIFLHQAVLAGVVLSALAAQQLEIFPHLINYPLHMHSHYPAERRPGKMNDLISGRYDTFFQDPAWLDLFPCDEPLRSWLVSQLVRYSLTS